MVIVHPDINEFNKDFATAMRHQVEINVAGRKLRVACPKGEESALIAAANELTQRIELANKSNSVATPEQAMLMTALNLANDLLKTQKAQEKDRVETQNKIELLQSTIEHALLSQQSKSA
ncbi:cell division protein ZapA [Thalassotalea atypica]|uniref:cell division protein ZapA n=1 Tax=Thalassotalea atypica TaxID=2054316 RepID=UPI002574135E|nr:cell division protein ZapA [Thalassotalea atypica]